MQVLIVPSVFTDNCCPFTAKYIPELQEQIYLYLYTSVLLSTCAPYPSVFSNALLLVSTVCFLFHSFISE